ncbi:MAG: hypothetical protein WBM83_01890 [Flavobacteriaceae bacterium]
MKKLLFAFVIGLFSMASFAHNPDASTTMLVEKENNSWVLQITASLTAFQQEIRTHFAETPYKTPEEFQKMVLEHIKNNLEISFNDGEIISLSQGMVKLGHETKVVYEVHGIPSDIQTVRIKNTTFKDISRNQNAFMLFKEGFTKEQFILNNANNHAMTLEVNGNKFVEVGPSKAGFSPKWYVTALLLAIGAFGTVMSLKLKKDSPIRVIRD